MLAQRYNYRHPAPRRMPSALAWVALARRLKAAAMAAWKHALCSVGRPAGEELMAVARKAG